MIRVIFNIPKIIFGNDTLIYHICCMPASKIVFDQEDLDFIKQYKQAKGISLQRFVTVAVKELRTKLEAQQYLEDLPYTEEK